jgi:hypothetical protein
VKATRGRYSGRGVRRRLRVKLSRAGMTQLKRAPGPSYFVGVDIDAAQGWIVAITANSPASLSSVPLDHPLNCTTIKRLWAEVNQYWRRRTTLPPRSSRRLRATP